MQFRIRKKPLGYVVEVQQAKWTLLGLKKVWKPYVKTSGLDEAWHHKTYDYALQNLLNQVKWETKAVSHL